MCVIKHRYELNIKSLCAEGEGWLHDSWACLFNLEPEWLGELEDSWSGNSLRGYEADRWLEDTNHETRESKGSRGSRGRCYVRGKPTICGGEANLIEGEARSWKSRANRRKREANHDGEANLIIRAYPIEQTGGGRRSGAGERCQVSEPHMYTWFAANLQDRGRRKLIRTGPSDRGPGRCRENKSHRGRSQDPSDRNYVWTGKV